MPRDDRNIPFDRSGGGRSNRFGDALGRMFSQNPLSWAFPLYTAFGIRVKIHVFFVLYIVFELLQAIPLGTVGFAYRAIFWASIWLLVLLHEYGHCFTCRRVGGEADEIILWPLGGLAMCRPPHDWRADLWTTVGGPAVNAALLIPLGALVLLLGGRWEAVLFNPFEPSIAITSLSGSWALIAAWSLHYSNVLLLAFNVLLPMFPMDGGRILQALLWSRMGHRRATAIAVKVGFVVAIILALFAIVFDQSRLVGLAIFGGFTCWAEHQRLQMMGDDFGQNDWRGGPDPAARRAAAESQREQKRRAAEAARAASEESEVNRLLDKIKKGGMQSLTSKERRFLEEATRRRRGA